jgi:hypothetical protein
MYAVHVQQLGGGSPLHIIFLTGRSRDSSKVNSALRRRTIAAANEDECTPLLLVGDADSLKMLSKDAESRKSRPQAHSRPNPPRD